MTLTATEVIVEVNMSSPSVYGLSLFPVVNFASTYADEQLALFDTDEDGVIEVGELRALAGQASGTASTGDLAGLYDAGADDADEVDVADIIALLDGAGDGNGLLELSEAEGALSTANINAGLIGDADADGDGKLDPLGLEIETGGDPVYLSSDGPIIRAQGFMELDVFGVVTLIGSIAFELGPTEDVTIVAPNGSTRTDTVTTMTIGAANVFGFVGWDGPYFIDANNNNEIDVDENNIPLPGEVNSSAKGIAINGLNVGMFLGVSTSVMTPGAYFAMDFSVDSIDVVGLDFLSATATLGVSLNLGLSLDLGEVIDFAASFPDEGGFEVNTGDPNSPVLIDFDGFLVNVELGGLLTVSPGGDPIASLQGVFFLELDGSSFKLFAQAAMRVGPDIASGTDPLLNISALGVVIINSAGFAADFDVDLDVGLPGLALTVSARVIINTTDADQELQIPDRLLDFLTDTSNDVSDPVNMMLAQDVLNRLLPAVPARASATALTASHLTSPTSRRC